MKLSELREVVVAMDNRRKSPDDDPEVCIVLKEPSMGPIAVAGVKSMSLGFDWDSGRVLIWPVKDLWTQIYR